MSIQTFAEIPRMWYNLEVCEKRGVRILITYIKGSVEHISDQFAIIENCGIGYIINAPGSTLGRLPPRGESVQIYTYLQVKEDDMSLYGFLAEEELRLFKMLISISGIGPKVAMAILASMSVDQALSAIASGDAVAFSRVPGVGKKTSQRITLELQDKIKGLAVGSSEFTAIQDSDSGGFGNSGHKQDAIDALTALGYGRSEGMRAVLSVATEDMPADQIIRLALKKLINSKS